MKITFSNLGAIKKTELDLRPFTVIIGPNNSNKTYIAYSVYGLWKHRKYARWHSLKVTMEDAHTYSLKLDNAFFELVREASKVSARHFQDTLEVFFQDSSRRLFAKTKFELEVSKEEIESAIKQLIQKSELKLSSSLVVKLTLKVDTLFIESKDMAHGPLIMEMTFAEITSLLFPSPLLLPAERNAFIITYKMLANRRYKLLRQAQRNLFTEKAIEGRQLELLREQGDIRYPEPIEDFLEFLTDTELQAESAGIPTNDKFWKLAEDIEQQIQSSHKTELRATKFGGKELKVNIKKGLNIDLYNASSSIKQLAPLLLYLRYRASENDLLIIDEPEMNLHPESQAKFLEVLAIMMNLGIRVLITTHSPYFMAHLNNLVSGKTSHPEVLSEQAKSLYLQDQRAFLHPDDVSAYEMRDNELVSLKDEDYGIRWDTLSDVSAELQQKYFEIYEKGESLRGPKE
jgi:predicted ATPase